MIIAFVPARGGSKSIPLKNVRLFCGKPLIYWSLKTLSGVDLLDKIVVATDSKQIKETVEGFGFDRVEVYMRDEINARDTSSTESVMLEFINKNHFSEEILFLLVQVTNPLIKSGDIRQAILNYKSSGADSMLSCARIKRFFWNENGTPVNYDYNNRPRRQEFNGMLIENGAFYLNSVKNIKQHLNRLSGKIEIYELPEYTSVELDEPEDWPFAELLMRKYILPEFESGAFNNLQRIKLFITDVDGVLTDSGMYYTEDENEMKKFSTRDGMGFELIKNAGILTGIITSENTKIVEKRARKLKIDYVFQGATNKIETLKELCSSLNIGLSDVAYIGDDLNDIQTIRAAGFSACPFDAHETIKKEVNYICTAKGGSGAVREVIDLILKK